MSISLTHILNHPTIKKNSDSAKKRMLFLTLVWCRLLHWIIEICKKQDILASHQFFHLTNRSFSSMWKNSGTNSTHKLIPQVFCWVEVRLPVMTSLIFPARDMLPYTIIIKSCYFMVSSPHFDPTIHLLYTDSSLNMTSLQTFRF